MEHWDCEICGSTTGPIVCRSHLDIAEYALEAAKKTIERLEGKNRMLMNLSCKESWLRAQLESLEKFKKEGVDVQ